MLILTRKLDEVIRINDDITITVIEIREGYRVRLGFTAPDNVRIHRQEVYEKIQQQKESA